MARKTIDCRTAPNDVGCTLAISGTSHQALNAGLGPPALVTVAT